MRWTTETFLEAKEAAGALLEALGLENYVFEIEPAEQDGDEWMVRLEWVRAGAWASTRLGISHELLMRSRRDAGARERALAAWRARVHEVRSAPPPRAH